MFHETLDPSSQQVNRNKLLDYIRSNKIENFTKLKTWLVNLKSIIETQPDNEFLKAFIEVNPKFFSYAYHFLTKDKDIAFKQAMLMELPHIKKNDLDIDKKLQQAVEIFRIRQEIIVEKNKDAHAKLDQLANDINKYFADYINTEKFKFYKIEALSGLNAKKALDIVKDPGKTYYLSADFETNIKNFSDILNVLQNSKIKIEQYAPQDKDKYYTILVDSNVSDIRKVSLKQIREFASKTWVYDKTNTQSRLETRTLKNSEFPYNKSVEKENQIFPKTEYDLSIIVKNEIINKIEKHILELKKSIIYSSNLKAKVESFEDLIKLIKSKPDDITFASVIKHWEENDSRSFINKAAANFTKGHLVNVTNLMKLECGFFTGYKLSEKSKSMQLIKDIKEYAKGLTVPQLPKSKN